MGRINGLFGWISFNDRRSILLFLSFLFAFHLLAVVGLFIPLAIYDPQHAPVYNSLGYAERYLLLITAVAAVTFGVQLWWHVNTIRRQSGFNYTFRGDEPRLCRIAEPLVIASGLPEPRLAIIESAALNAFACGTSSRNAVVVVTRGLLDGLDDNELAAVFAHELMHIKNGDVRLIAAANVCLASLTMLHAMRLRRTKKYQEGATLAIMLFVLPVMFVVILVLSFLRQSAVHLGNLTRLVIASSREFVADAEAIQLTKDPAAMISALQRIAGHSQVADLPPEQDAMMIDGPTEGAMATHPLISERIAAIISVTGSMALMAVNRGDTRDPALRAPVGFGRKRTMLAPEGFASGGSRSTVGRIAMHSDRNMLGLTNETSIAVIGAILAFFIINRADIQRPAAIAAHFDVRQFSMVMQLSGKAGACQLQGIGYLVGLSQKPKNCGDEFVHSATGQNFITAKQMGWKDIDTNPGMHLERNGSTTNIAPPTALADIVRTPKCFTGSPYSVGDRGTYRVDGSWVGGSSATVSMSRYLGFVSGSVGTVQFARTRQDRDAALKHYVETRKTMIETTHRFFGVAGLKMVQEAYAGPEHAAIVSQLRERLGDPGFSASLDQVTLAEYRLLTTTPGDFITCVARKDGNG